VTLIVFYLVGSKATKVGKQLKAKLEDGHHAAGYRNAWQVLCNSFSAFSATILWDALYAPGLGSQKSLSRILRIEQLAYDSDIWCPLSAAVSQGWSRTLVLATLGHFACCMGDTLASELGVLSTTPPILITTLKTVPPGTNGAISILGTLASIAGGLLMGATFATSLLIENTNCRESWIDIFVTLVIYGGFAGFFGSLVDSFLGATLQRTRYVVDSKLILQDHSETPTGSDVKVISGLNVLTNNQVNFLSSVLTAVTLGCMGG